jgi:S-DNA-T family DNA segregation ATPase FtsK/SpoIIIE
MMFCNLDEQRTIEVSITVSKEFAKPLVANEAYFVEGSHITKLRTVKPSKVGVEEAIDDIEKDESEITV